MRQICLALCVVWLAPAWASAQQPPAVDPNAARLNDVLMQWERAMTNMNSLTTTVTRTELKPTFNSLNVYEGQAKMVKSNLPKQPCRASLVLVKKGRPEVWEKYICTGTFVYIFDPANKVIRVADPPKGRGRIDENNFMDFLFGMKAVEARQQYHITYIPPQDKWYQYLRILPRNDKDKQTFVEARVTLNAQTFLPRQLWFKQPNGDEVTWDFPRMVPNGDVPATEFQIPQADRGWTMQRIGQK